MCLLPRGAAEESLVQSPPSRLICCLSATLVSRALLRHLLALDGHAWRAGWRMLALCRRRRRPRA